jgi:methyl-CpG-binding domain protein 4
MSPYELLQEIYFDDPWKSQVCCILLNCTRRVQVDKIRDELFSRYSTPARLADADPAELAELLRPLGFYNRRARSLIRFSTEWINLDWKHPRELYGIGQYAADSWDIFYNGRLDINPDDGVLVKYVIWKNSNLELSTPTLES